MTIVVETGLVVAGANSYNSITELDTYFALRRTAWADLDQADDKEPAAILAWDYMLATYRNLWQGYRYSFLQEGDWPRVGVIVDDYVQVLFNVIPPEVKKAHAELAYRQATVGDLAPDVERAERRVKVGPIEVEFDQAAPITTVYVAVNDILRPLFSEGASGMTAKTIRV